MYILLIVLVLIAAVLAFEGNYFYNYAILRRKKKFLNQDPDLKHITNGVGWQSNKEWLEQQAYQELKVISNDDLLLNAIYLPNADSSDKVVILVHGYSSWSGSMAAFAQYYKESLGYSVLIPDLRGHGKSEGSYIGFGWHDRKDLLRWISHMIEKHGSSCQIVLHGISMGGATVLMASGEDLPDNVKCIISDCGYSSMEGIMGYQMKRMFKLPKSPLIEFTSLICKLRAGYFFSEASAVNQVRKSTLPMLFIHGSDDRFVPTEMVHELYDAAKTEKQMLVVSRAAHGMSFWQDPEAYKAAVEDFLDKYM